MRNVRIALALALSFTAFGVQVASAQTICPTAEEGSACSDGGICVPADCTIASGDGGTTEGPCGLCVTAGPNYCPAADVGQACGDGGTCTGGGGSAGGSGMLPDAAPPDAGTLTGFSYNTGECNYPFDAGDSGVVGKDAGVVVTNGADAAAGSGGGSADAESGQGDGDVLNQGADAGSKGKDAASDEKDSGSSDDATVVLQQGGDASRGHGSDATTAGGSQDAGGSGGCSTAPSDNAAGLLPLGLIGLGLTFLRRRRGAAEARR